MHPTLDPNSKSKPDELARDAELQAGYIRYIRILPTEGPNEEICLETCIRRSRSHDESRKHLITNWLFYSAISYAWGDPTSSHSVIVDGHERMVATNLWHFLQHAARKHTYLRRTHSQRVKELLDWEEDAQAWGDIIDEDDTALAPGSLEARSRLEGVREEMTTLQQKAWPENWLWIDALCIDQADARERTHQVGIMSEIFGRADQVISWLGRAYDTSAVAMAVIADYASNDHASERYARLRDELASAICSLCERPYWKRLWVFQELRHAKQIMLMCGPETISWDQFTMLWRVVVDIAMTDEDRSDRLQQSLATRMMTLRTKPLNFSLWNLLRETKTLECADQRDRVYALLSVASEGREGIEAEYVPHVTALRLAHRTLQNKYKMRLPRSLDDVLTDCRFLEDVFRLNPGAMLRYHRYGHELSARHERYRNELQMWYVNDWPRTLDAWYLDEMESQSGQFLHRSKFAKSPHRTEHADVSSYVDTESSQADSSWSEWAGTHGQDAVTELL
jgi:hypothetical protein